MTAAGWTQAQTAEAAATGVGTSFPCPSFCGGPGARFDFDTDGGEGFAASFSSVSNRDGSGRAEASLNGPTSLPILRAEAFSPAAGNSRAQADAVGMQGFYVGTNGLTTYTLNLALSGLASGMGSVRATVLVFTDFDPSSLPGFSTGASTMAGETIPLTGDLELVGELDLSLTANGLPGNAIGAIDISDVSTGDLVYVWAALYVSGQNGGVGDAYNTLNLSFTDATGLSQTAPIPEPASALLLVAGLAALRRFRRG